MDIDKELEQIIETYNLDRHYPAYRVSRQACDFLQKWVKRLAGEKKTILFLGMDEHALKLIAGWARAENIHTLFIESLEKLEKDKGKNGIEMLNEADAIYVVSYSRTIELLHWLWRHDFQAESVYDILESEQIYLQMEFYRFFTPLKMSQEFQLDEFGIEKSVDGSSSALYEFHYQKQRRNHGISEKCEKIIIEKLFFLAICMRNFLEAERILETMENAVEFKECWHEIQNLLVRAKRMLKLKQQEDIVIYWLDALPYEEAKLSGYLQSRRKHSVYFHNAYTMTPYTTPTCKNMFCGIQQVDDLGYRVRHVDIDNSSLLKNIINQGYQFSLISDYLKRLFPLEYSCSVGITKETTSSEIFWELVKEILQSEQKTVYLAHVFVELHAPMLSVKRERFESQYAGAACRKIQIEELDEQLCFYDELLGGKNYRIYMSDHGYGDLWKRFHIHFQVYHASWKGRETEELFCLLDFEKIMRQLLSRETLEDSGWDRKYVPIQDVHYYNKNNLRRFLKEKIGIGLLYFIAYKGVVTKEGIYIRFKTEDELFCKWSEELTRVSVLLDEPMKKLPVFQELRVKTGAFPLELDTDSKFQYGTYAYKAYQNVKKTIRVAGELMNEKVSVYADDSIVLRMGGEHSLQLYNLLKLRT